MITTTLEANMLLSYLPDAEVEMLMTKAKQDYVTSKHNHKISYLQSKGVWRTFVGNKQPVTRRKRDDLIDYLYEYYKGQERYTIKQVFELSQERAEIMGNKPNTIEHKRQDYDRFITDEFGDRFIEDVDADDLATYIMEQVKAITPKERALDTFKTTLTAIFDTAMLKQIIKTNPMSAIMWQQYYKYCDTTTKQAKDKVFTKTQMFCLKQWYATNHRSVYDPQFYAVEVCFLTGMRVGEVPPLRWDDIDWYKQTLHIHRQQIQERIKGQPGHFYIVEYTKNERRHPNDGRYFPLYDELSELLNQIRNAQTQAGIQSDYIFCDENGEPITKQSISKVFYSRNKKLGYDITNIHAIRMSFNSNVLRYMGLPSHVIAYILGHTEETNSRAYTYTREEQVDEVRQAFNSKPVNTYEHFSNTNVVHFPGNKKALESAKFKGLKKNI